MNTDVLVDAKLLKRHNKPGILISIFCMLSVGIPILLIVLPWFKMTMSLGGNWLYAPGDPIRLSAVTLFRHLFNMKSGARGVTHIAWEASQARESYLSYYLTQENLYAAAIWYLLSALMAVILFFQGLIVLIRGKAVRPGALVVGLFLSFVCNAFLLGDSIRMGFYLQFITKKAAGMTGAEAPVIKFEFWPAIIIASVAALFYFVALFVYLFCLRNRYYREDVEFVDIDPKPFEKNNGVLRNTLPNSVTAIGGHAFAKNVNLEIANIPQGISELGIGAFSNCIRLKVVSIPKSVKKIGPNCFFNCGKLQRINYGGSKEQWRYIYRGSNWLEKAGTTTVLCVDGPISVNPKH